MGRIGTGKGRSLRPFCVFERKHSMSRQSYELDATVRDVVGKGAARALRREAQVPAVIYGDKKPPLPISLAFKETDKRLRAGGFMTTVSTINVAGEKILVIPKDYAMHPVKDQLVHVDFLRVSANSTVTVYVPVHITGQEKSPGLKKGGAVNYAVHEVQLSARADAIPEAIEIDVSELDFNDTVHISAVKLPVGAKPISTEDFTVISITPPVGSDA
jgi:large subunit ribosomal protein L25